MERDSLSSQVPAATVTSSGPPSTRTILIVDDEANARNVLVEMLNDAGIPSWTTGSGEEALRIIQTQSFNAVLADLQMPGISGMQLLAEFRTHAPYTAFLIVTGVDDLQVGIDALKNGADDYLVKPLQYDLVLASLHRALQKRELQFQLDSYRQGLEEMVEQRTRELKSALHQIESSYTETLQALGAAIDLRDGETGGHSRRVASYSVRIAKELKASSEELKTIKIGAWLHDIGKLAIPDAILLKPDKLTDEEWIVMQGHVRLGYDMVRRIPFLAEAAEIILTHHERWDGSGYPRGLAGIQIPFGARIFGVADTVDAMTSKRPYRPALPLADALQEIRNGLGGRYDPEISGAFLQINSEEWEAIRSQDLLFGGHSDGNDFAL